MFHAEKMRTEDFPFAVQLANTMDWNMAEEDFEFMTKLEPDGCFVLWQAQEPVGVATCISYGKTGWFGNLAVKEEHRRKGAGTFLLKHALCYLRKKGVETVGLYAYPHLIGFYESFGFEPDADFLVLQGEAVSSATEGTLREAKKQDVPALIDFDSQCFGAYRKKLLEPILLNMSNLCYISNYEKEITGYVAAKVYYEMAEVGPLICQSNRVDAAVMLLKTILSRLKGLDVSIYVPKKEAALLDMLTKAGFKEDFRVARMFLGPAIAKNCIYTAESLERG
jgi:GNAT superfamily N-acetyltransferase